MKPQFHTFEPVETSSTTIRPDIVGFYPYALNGNYANSHERLQAVATKVGIPIVAAEVMGQVDNRLYGQPASHALHAGKPFRETARRQAEAVLQQLSGYEKRVGIGHSLGGVAIGGMQLYGEEPPFTTVELADAFNLWAPESIPHAYIQFLAYQLVDSTLHTSPSAPEEPSTRASRFSQLRRMHNVSSLMRNTEGVNNAMLLAADPALPLHVISFDHSIIGSAHQVSTFLQQLEEIRAGAATKAVTATPLLTSFEPGWHSNLIDAAKVAANLQRTLSLV